MHWAPFLPREILNHIRELQQTLLKDDCYIPNLVNGDPLDKSRRATVTASSEKRGAEAANVINGTTRFTADRQNLWSSDGLAPNGETLFLTLEEPAQVSQVRLIFDTDFHYSIKQTQATKRQKQQRIGTPPELVRDYTLTLWKNGTVVYEQRIADNYQRANILAFPPVLCDQVTVSVTQTNGCPDAHIYEVRIY